MVSSVWLSIRYAFKSDSFLSFKEKLFSHKFLNVGDEPMYDTTGMQRNIFLYDFVYSFSLCQVSFLPS